MDFRIAPASLDDEKLVKLIKDYYDAYQIDHKTFKPPAQWVGAFRVDDLMAAIGFTRSPDSSIVFVAEFICERSTTGIRALQFVADAFQAYCADHPDIQLVVAQCLASNKVMNKFLEKHTFMRPASTVFACAKSDLAKENESGRWVRL